MRYLIALIFIAAIHSTLFAQIVNVESQRIKKIPRVGLEISEPVFFLKEMR